MHPSLNNVGMLRGKSASRLIRCDLALASPTAPRLDLRKRKGVLDFQEQGVTDGWGGGVSRWGEDVRAQVPEGG